MMEPNELITKHYRDTVEMPRTFMPNVSISDCPYDLINIRGRMYIPLFNGKFGDR